MFVTIEQLASSLPYLHRLNPFFGMSFLAFKRIDLPIGSTAPVIFTQIVEEVLEQYYRVVPTYSGFYNPFHTSDPGNRWTAERYGSTSLQRITSDTFSDVFEHPKGSSLWGWKSDYIQRLARHLGSRRISAFHLGIWLYRNHDWPQGATPVDVVLKLRADFNINEFEYRSLFADDLPPHASKWTTFAPISEGDLLELIGDPPGLAPPSGAALRKLVIREVGPARHIVYEPAERLNLITGNNSLGKTFLLETIWWALTGNWLAYPADPHRNVARREPNLSFTLVSPRGKQQIYSAKYGWERQQWIVSPATPRTPGLTIYARYDGSFAVWDPARAQLERIRSSNPYPGRVFLSRDQVWNGTGNPSMGSETRASNGLLADWILWQTGGERYREHYSAFISSLTELSPSEAEPLRPGEPTRFPLDARSIPTLEMPYGVVPILHASAAVQRVVALAYVLVWAWQEYLVSCGIIRQEPQRNLVVIVDEIEAHLHPLWQRLIAPSLIRVTDKLASAVNCQLHIATHSPLVLASIETIFDRSRDELHHLRAADRTVELDVIPFVKRGRADLWLLSDAFGLGQARSLPAEKAIGKAKQLQLEDAPDPREVSEVDAELVKVLASDDEFWPRWRYFAEKNRAVD